MTFDLKELLNDPMEFMQKLFEDEEIEGACDVNQELYEWYLKMKESLEIYERRGLCGTLVNEAEKHLKRHWITILWSEDVKHKGFVSLDRFQLMLVNELSSKADSFFANGNSWTFEYHLYKKSA